jgi:hypothetical protein
MDFSRVLVTDKLAWELFGAAAREELLLSRHGDERDLPRRKGVVRQRSLSPLVLFDQLVLHDFGGAFRLPDLEKDGIVEVVRVDEPPGEVAPLRTRWKKGPMALRGRPPRKLLQSLTLIERFRPLVINRLLTIRGMEFFTVLADGLRIPRRRCLELFFDYAFAAVRGDEAALREHVFEAAFPADFLREMTDELFDFTSRSDRMIGPTNAVLICAIAAADEIAIIQSLSTTVGVGVATEHYAENFRSEHALRGKELDAVTAANRLLTLRAAFAEEGGLIPRIDSIKDALALRKNPHLKAMREQLALLHSGLTVGDRQAILEARRAIRKARQRLQHRVAWERALRWVAYLSVPVGVAELLSGAPPLVGTSIAVIGAAGTAGSRKVEKDNEWVLFGT